MYLKKSIPAVAAQALELCLKQVTPRIMTWQQYGEAAYHLYQKNVLGREVRGVVDWGQRGARGGLSHAMSN